MNALARDILPPIGELDLIAAWPAALPWPQMPSVQINWEQPTDDIGTLTGPTRFRLAHLKASPSYEFEIVFTATECESFEGWYNDAVARGGELYLPWIGEGRIVALTEYELTPVGRGWKLHALAVQLYLDPDYCERHVCDAIKAWRAPVIVDADADYPQIICELPSLYWRPRLTDLFWSFDPIPQLIDPWDAPDTVIADLTAADVWNGHTLSRVAELRDTITADLGATDLFIDIPENWIYERELEEWYARNRMVYIDDWQTLGVCRLLKDTLPPPYAIVENRDWSLTRIVADDFPLELYRRC